MSESHECPACGGEFDTGAGMRRHYGAMHGSTKVEVECATCRTPKMVTRCRYERNDNFFCDLECRGEYDSESRRGENNPNYVERIEFECDNCGRVEDRLPSKINEEGNNFCNRSCYEEYQNTREAVVCAQCGSEREYRRSRRRDSILNFCSRECRYEFQVGENHPRWAGGYEPYYGPNWEEQRRKARDRDNFECQSCGVSEDGIDQELDVHHKKPFREFVSDEGGADYEKANALENLVCLCPSCHKRAEQMTPLIPTFD